MAEDLWTYVEIDHGHASITNGDITVSILSDFSGNLTSAAGDFFEFKDLREFIKGGKLLEKMLVEHYGGWE